MDGTLKMSSHEQVVASRLMAARDTDPEFWDWLAPGEPLSKKSANKFFLASIIDYQIKAETAWSNAKRLSEEILRDPEDLWGAITSVSLSEWNDKWRHYSLHRFPKAHERVFTIGERLVQRYDSDARKIWTGQSIEATLYRLLDIGAGEQISRMIVGALIDVGILRGKADVKVDIHVRRVLGRLLFGKEISINEAGEAIDATRRMHPDNPWLLDRPLYRLGKSVCSASNPTCFDCEMKDVCKFPIS